MNKIKNILPALICTIFLCSCNHSAAGDSAIIEQVEIETTSTTVSETTVASENSSVVNILKGYWVNIDKPFEQWAFKDNGILEITGEEHTYSVTHDGTDKSLTVDGNTSYSFYIIYSDCLILTAENDDEITLYAEGSPEIIEARRVWKFKESNAELFEKFPDSDGWMESCDYGDIPELADADYIEKSLADGIFFVSTPEELASFNYYVNTFTGSQFLFMQLQNDIDLDGYNWVPMGWSGYGASGDHPFTCWVDGNGHTIKNMSIVSDDSDIGFIGWETFCCVTNITFENAFVSGGSNTGIITGQAIGGSYENCHVSGTVIGRCAGSLLGYDANCSKKNCTADVIVNGESFDFLSWNDKEKSEIVIENPVEITIDETYTVTRPEVEGYQNLGWHIFYNGEQVLHRNAENELSYQYFMQEPGTYEIYLSAYVSGQYVPISNIITYTIE